MEGTANFPTVLKSGYDPKNRIVDLIQTDEKEFIVAKDGTNFKSKPYRALGWAETIFQAQINCSQN